MKTELYCFARISAFSWASSQSLPFPLRSGGMPTLSRLLDLMYDLQCYNPCSKTIDTVVSSVNDNKAFLTIATP